MSEVHNVHERSPGLLAHAKLESRQLLHMLQRRPILDVAGGVDPHRHTAILSQFSVQGFTPGLVELKAVEEYVELVRPQSAFNEILQKEHIERRTGSRQAPEPLLKNQRNIQIHSVRLIEEALVVQQHGDFRTRCAVRLKEKVAELVKALEQRPKCRFFAGID